MRTAVSTDLQHFQRAFLLLISVGFGGAEAVTIKKGKPHLFNEAGKVDMALLFHGLHSHPLLSLSYLQRTHPQNASYKGVGMQRKNNLRSLKVSYCSVF